MGYSTEFNGRFELDSKLTPEHADYLARFACTRRMKRDAKVTVTFTDDIRLAAGLPVGIDGSYFVGSPAEDFGQDKTPDIIDYNRPPYGQPGLWCQWVPSCDGLAIEWDGSEKFYEYVDWIRCLISHFLTPWGYRVNGEVTWQGEESDDMGMIVITNNVVTTKQGKVTYV